MLGCGSNEAADANANEGSGGLTTMGSTAGAAGPDTTSWWYGMTADVDGYIWNCGTRAARFNPTTESWTVSPELGVSSGCMADGDPGGLLWMSYFGGVRGVDRTSFDILHDFATRQAPTA